MRVVRRCAIYRWALRALSPAVLAGLLAVFTPVWGAIAPLTLAQLSKKTPVILTGKVTAISNGYRAQWRGIGRVVCSDVTIRIESKWKGEWAAEEIVLQNPGGTLSDGTRVVCSEAPRFEVGERVLVFVGRYQGRDAVFSWDQGKYTIAQDRVLGKPGYAIDEDQDLKALEQKVKSLTRKGG